MTSESMKVAESRLKRNVRMLMKDFGRRSIAESFTRSFI